MHTLVHIQTDSNKKIPVYFIYKGRVMCCYRISSTEQDLYCTIKIPKGYAIGIVILIRAA